MLSNGSVIQIRRQILLVDKTQTTTLRYLKVQFLLYHSGLRVKLPVCLSDLLFEMASPSIGVFTDTVGLSYKCGNLSGFTSSPDGEFHYHQGESISFSISSLHLGVAKGGQRLSVLDLVNNPSLTNPKLLNRAALLFSLTPSLGFEKAIQIDDNVGYKSITV
jgi:hypothetical protein